MTKQDRRMLVQCYDALLTCIYKVVYFKSVIELASPYSFCCIIGGGGWEWE